MSTLVQHVTERVTTCTTCSIPTILHSGDDGVLHNGNTTITGIPGNTSIYTSWDLSDRVRWSEMT
jgi:hypothetical protein